MGHQENRISDSPFSSWIDSNKSPSDENLHLSAARSRAREEAGGAIARQLNGPLTALLLYMGEIKQHSDQLSQAAENGFICGRWSTTRFSRPSACAR